jgi:predicted amino acid-binding ACT domain protein
MNIQRIAAILAFAVLAGCGAETMGTAATGAKIKKQELQQAQRNLERAKERIGQAIEIQQQRASQSLEPE